jgi:RimJ/RimL family protein N-acetyltransferase
MLRLRPLRAEDVSVLDRLSRDDAEWQRRLGMPHSTWWGLVSAGPERFGWLAVLGDDVVGYLDAERVGDAVSVALAIFKAWRGRGFAKELASLAIAVEPLAGARSIIAAVESDNAASHAVARAVGFVEDGQDEDGLILYRIRRCC